MQYQNGLKRKLLDFLKLHGTITRKEAYAWSSKNKYHQATFERRCRELVEEVGVIPLGFDGKRTIGNEVIVAWKWRNSTVFN